MIKLDTLSLARKSSSADVVVYNKSAGVKLWLFMLALRLSLRDIYDNVEDNNESV